uniref:starch-binding protein n=1 Tax=Prevotella sp. TaxID=59823 RepID=UPI0040273EB7
MKKRFTLMMMVLCILMSIPLKMMAESVTVHFIDKNGWTGYDAYVYDISTNKEISKDHAWPGKHTDYTISTVNSNKVVTWTIELGTCSLANARIIFNNGSGGQDNQYPGPNNGGFEVANNQYYNNDGKTTDPSQGGSGTGSGSGTGGTTGGGSTDPTEKWDTEIVNRLKGRVYSQGFYLAGNFFSFQPKDGDNQITYDDAVFKFQQQNDAEGYDVYKVEIPASLTARAQVMYVDEFGKTKNIFGPGKYSISRTSPETDNFKGWLEAKPYVCDPINKEIDNCWNFVSRNESENEYSDGMYNLYIAVDATTHEVKKWKIVHDSDKRVAYFISDAPDATALPVYDAYDKNVKYFSNRFYASVNFSADRSYYVISNYVHDQQLVSITKDKGYGTIKNNKNYLSTANKLFLQGNGGYEFSTSDQHNEFSPNEKPMPGNDLGTIIVEYKAKQANYQSAEKENHLGIRGQVHFRDGFKIIKSVSMVGDAIPGTLNDDDSWDYTSKAADMIYDDVEQCYTTTIVTTVDDGKKHFRFVGNHTEDINWYEDTDGSEPKKMARTLYTDSEKEGHTADVNDPNKVNYTKKDGAKSEAAYHIIWNRPAGRWTVRFYFYTYNVDGEPVTDYYYTISPCKDLELRDCVNIVYKSEDNKRVIQNVGEYKFLRTWSDEKAWKVSKDIDIYVVDQLSADKKNNAVTLHLNLLDSKDKSGKYNVIPADLGVILGTKKEAADIEGGAVFHKSTSLTSLNTVVVPMYEYNASADEAAEPAVTSKLHTLTYAKVVPTSEIVDGKVTYNYLFGAGKGKSVGITPCGDNDFFMGFWISNGKGNFYSNSCYLSIDKETADILGVGTRNDQFDPVTYAKKVPGVIFDFANVGGTTGINEVVNQSTKLNDGKYYTLSGQQVEKPTAGGIYIHNGRKFVVK